MNNRYSTPNPVPEKLNRCFVGCVTAVLLLSSLFIQPLCAAGEDRKAPMDQNQITFVDRPSVETANAHYIGNRAPLRPLHFIKLPVGSIRPAGWLHEAMDRQRKGLVGNLHKISAWLKREDNAWLSKDGQGAWGWEEVPYWLRGYGNLGYTLGDEDIIKEAKVWIEGALASQREDGNFGPVRQLDNGSQDFWANMVMLHCLQSYYEYTQDPRVLELMTRFFRYQNSISDKMMLKGFWQRMRGGDNLHSVYWLYNLTGEPFLLELADKLYRNTADWEKPVTYKHNVNVAQGFRTPAQYYQQTGNPKHLAATYHNFHFIRKGYGQVPGGMFGGDENTRKGYDDPRQAIETCGIVEQMRSNEMLLRITGDPFWADHAELVAFNSAPAAYTPDYRALRYLTSPNMATSDRHNHAPGVRNKGPFMLMNPLSHRCCQHNHAQGWPYYAEHLWLATPDNGLCAALYVPATVTATVGEGEGVKVQIVSETRYPFEEQASFTVNPAEPTRFPLYFRIPAWCDAPVLKVNGDTIQAEKATGRYVRIEKTWASGDTVELQMPMQIEITTWKRNHDSVSVSRGPLTFSLKIGQDFKKIPSEDTTLHSAKWQDDLDVKDWPAIEILPTTPWNYGLVLDGDPAQAFEVKFHDWPEDNYPFAADSAPISLFTKAKRIPKWSLDKHGLVAPLQDSPAYSNEPTERIELIPMGATNLRISAFPVASDAKDAVRWKSKAPTGNVEHEKHYHHDDH